MFRARSRTAIATVATLIVVPFTISLLGTTAAAVPGGQGKSPDHSQQAEHSKSDKSGSSSSSKADHSSGNAGTSGEATSPQPPSKADFSGNGANTHGPYDSTRDGSPSLNGNGGGKAVGKPCAGCVGKADNKNPKGQMPNGSDPNAGYECDRNHGIGRSNPAHTSCQTAPPEQPPGQPPVDVPPGDVPPDHAPPVDMPPVDVPPDAAPPSELPDTGANTALLPFGLAALAFGGALLWMSARNGRSTALM